MPFVSTCEKIHLFWWFIGGKLGLKIRRKMKYIFLFHFFICLFSSCINFAKFNQSQHFMRLLFYLIYFYIYLFSLFFVHFFFSVIHVLYVLQLWSLFIANPEILLVHSEQLNDTPPICHTYMVVCIDITLCQYHTKLLHTPDLLFLYLWFLLMLSVSTVSWHLFIFFSYPVCTMAAFFVFW